MRQCWNDMRLLITGKIAIGFISTYVSTALIQYIYIYIITNLFLHFSKPPLKLEIGGVITSHSKLRVWLFTHAHWLNPTYQYGRRLPQRNHRERSANQNAAGHQLSGDSLCLRFLQTRSVLWRRKRRRLSQGLPRNITPSGHHIPPLCIRWVCSPCRSEKRKHCSMISWKK